jgi:hypothetical protein
MKVTEEQFQIEGGRAIHKPTGSQIWLDMVEAGKTRTVHCAKGVDAAKGGYDIIQVKVIGARMLEKRGY